MDLAGDHLCDRDADGACLGGPRPLRGGRAPRRVCGLWLLSFRGGGSVLELLCFGPCFAFALPCFAFALLWPLLLLLLLLLLNFSLTSRFEQWSQVMTTRVAPTSTQMYFALLHLHPVRVNVSFTIVGRNAAAASGGGGQADKGSGAGASGGGPSGGGSVLWVGDMCVWGGSKCRLVIFDCCVYVFSFHLLIAIVPFPRRRAAAKRRAVGRRPARWRRCSRRWGCRWSRLMRRR